MFFYVSDEKNEAAFLRQPHLKQIFNLFLVHNYLFINFITSSATRTIYTPCGKCVTDTVSSEETVRCNMFF
jgi:hypothetical protein